MNYTIMNEYYKQLATDDSLWRNDIEQAYPYSYLQEELYVVKKDDLIVLVKANSPRKAIDKCKSQLRFITNLGTLNINN